MKPELLASANGSEVWHGDSLDPAHVAVIMGGRLADLLLVDAPYSERTHAGHRAGTGGSDSADRAEIVYASWSPLAVERFTKMWVPLVSGWVASVTDHHLAPTWSSALDDLDRYTFAPLPWVETGSRVRLAGDGPSSWTCWLIVARPRSKPFSKWGTLPGAYIAGSERRETRIIGGKSFKLTCDLIRDYSRDGQLVIDPCLGGGTTLAAAITVGRRCIGIERDRGRAEACSGLLTGARAAGNQIGMFK